jgi:hypothetical protein
MSRRGSFGFSHFKIKGIMVGAAGVEGGLANRTTIIGSEIVGNAEGVPTVAAKDCLGLPFSFAPHNGSVDDDLVMTLNTGIKSVAALEFNGDDITLGVIMRALSSSVDAGAVTGD